MGTVHPSSPRARCARPRAPPGRGTRGFAAQAALLRSYIGADEKKKQIITELMRRLAIDVKDELMKAAGGGLRAATQALSEWKNSK